MATSNNTASILKDVTVHAFQTSFYAVGTSYRASVSGALYIAASTETVTYATSGVLKSDSRWTWTFNGWDRLVCGTSANLSPNLKLEFTYYPDGQRATKAVYENNGGTWSNTFTHAFVYDGWNLIREEITCHTGVTDRVTIREYLWGLDLAGKRDGQYGQSAGGIGGLLAISVRESSSTNVYLVVTDHQGSVHKLVDMNTAQVVAEFCYSPFGVLGEWYADASTEARVGGSGFRFMTKYYDAETELLYFGYRYYDASAAKWLVPDPLEETLSEPNITAFCRNDPINSVDPLGLDVVEPGVWRVESGENLWKIYSILHERGAGDAISWERFIQNVQYRMPGLDIDCISPGQLILYRDPEREKLVAGMADAYRGFLLAKAKAREPDGIVPPYVVKQIQARSLNAQVIATALDTGAAFSHPLSRAMKTNGEQLMAFNWNTFRTAMKQYVGKTSTDGKMIQWARFKDVRKVAGGAEKVTRGLAYFDVAVAAYTFALAMESGKDEYRTGLELTASSTTAALVYMRSPKAPLMVIPWYGYSWTMEYNDAVADLNEFNRKNGDLEDALIALRLYQTRRRQLEEQ